MIPKANFDKNPPRLHVPLTEDELTELRALALTANTSPAVLGQVAVRQMLVQARAGALPMVPPSRYEDAIEVGYSGQPLIQVPPLPGRPGRR